MKHAIIKKFNRSAKKHGAALPKDIFADKRVHDFENSGRLWRYVLDADDPAVGMYECKELNIRKRIFGESDADIDEIEIKEKLGILRKKLKQASLSAMRDEPEMQDNASVDADESKINELAALSDIKYERVRKSEASGLGVRVSVLDKAVEKARRRIWPGCPTNKGDQLEFRF